MHGKIKACIQVCLGTTNTVALCDSGNLSDTDLCHYGTFKKAYQDQPGKMPMMTPFTRPLRGAGSNQLKVVRQVKVPLTIKGVQPRWESRMVLVCNLGVPMILSAKTLAWMPAIINLAWAVVYLGPYGQRVPLVATSDAVPEEDDNTGEPMADYYADTLHHVRTTELAVAGSLQGWSSRTSNRERGSTVRDLRVQPTCTTTTRHKDTQQAATMQGSKDHGSTVRDPRVQPTCTTTKRKSVQRAATMRGSDDQGSTEKDPWVQTALAGSAGTCHKRLQRTSQSQKAYHLHTRYVPLKE